MKKLLVITTIIGLVGFFWVASFAQVKQLPTSKIEPKAKLQRLFITGLPIKNLISAENDKSQPPDSLTQRYRVLFETLAKQRDTMVIEVGVDNKGKIIKSNIVSSPKAGGGMVQPIQDPFLICDRGYKVCCVKIIIWRTGEEIEVCACCKEK